MAPVLNVYATPELCKLCKHYNFIDRTCSLSVAAKSKSKTFYDFAKAVRNDPKRCGIEAYWFEEK
jgi:hypothetical protein